MKVLIEIEQTDLEKIFEDFLEPIPAAVMARIVYVVLYDVGEQLDASNGQVIEWLSKALPQITSLLTKQMKATGQPSLRCNRRESG